MELSLKKVHGSENDFFILDETELSKPLTETEINTLVQQLCPRETGFLGGADGLLLVQAATHELAENKMRVINSDGSEASMCGNGLRTVARYLAEKKNKTEFLVETMHADLKVRKSDDLSSGVSAFQVEISPVSFQAAAIPMTIKKKETVINSKISALSKELRFSVVAVPNPHLIAFVDHETLTGSELERIAQIVNGENQWFPDGVNVSFVEVLGENEIFVRTYERGVGFTNACGTAMCASSLMYVLLKNGSFMSTIKVKNPGGMVKTVVHQDPEGQYWMELIGNATVTSDITMTLEDALANNFEQAQVVETQEQKDYLEFLKTIGIATK